MTASVPSRLARPSKKQQSHERIVRAAAHAIRKGGYDGVSVADIMQEAGLTHGGFYAHFASRDAMLAEALDYAAAQSLKALTKASAAPKVKNAFATVVEAYLSDRHLAAPESGCTLAALGCETRRQSHEVRRIATRGVKELVDMIARQLPEWGKARSHEDALAALSCMVGAMVVARAVADPVLARDIRKASSRFIRRGIARRQPRH
jgi:TetR/AcrR family transcriptional repressor of nem operon